MVSSLHTATSLEFEGDSFRSALGRSPIGFRHPLAGSPFLAVPALAAIADNWPVDALEHHLARDLPLLLPTGETDRLPLGAGDVIRGIATNQCWVALWFLESLDVFRTLMDEHLDPLAACIGGHEGGMHRRGVNVLVASPGALVPAHFDLHHNLLMQVEGTKEVMVGFYDDPGVAQHEYRDHFEGGTNNVRRVPDKVATFRLAPGDGVYIPPYGVHWVRGGPEHSVSLSFGFRTARSARMELAYVCNAKLRKLGLSPTAPGRSVVADEAKAMLVRSKRTLHRAITATRLRVRSHRG